VEPRNPVATTFMFSSQISPVEFELHYSRFETLLRLLLELSGRLHVQLELPEKVAGLSNIIKLIKEKIRHIL
jgi:hypothetical protein